jgi:hypothetical protein
MHNVLFVIMLHSCSVMFISIIIHNIESKYGTDLIGVDETSYIITTCVRVV